jgi:hypothetical protein
MDDGWTSDHPLNIMSIHVFFNVLKLADRLLMDNLVTEFCKRMTQDFEASLWLALRHNESSVEGGKEKKHPT